MVNWHHGTSYPLGVAKLPVSVIALGAVHFANLGLAGQFGGQFLPDGCQTLAMATPWREKLDKDNSFLDSLLKGVFIDHGNIRALDFFFSFGSLLTSIVSHGGHKVFEGGQISASFVRFDDFSILDEMQGGIASDLVVLANALSLGAVQFGNFDW